MQKLLYLKSPDYGGFSPLFCSSIPNPPVSSPTLSRSPAWVTLSSDPVTNCSQIPSPPIFFPYPTYSSIPASSTNRQSLRTHQQKRAGQQPQLQQLLLLQIQQALPVNPQATPHRQSGRRAANLHFSLCSTRPSVSTPALQQNIFCSLSYSYPHFLCIPQISPPNIAPTFCFIPAQDSSRNPLLTQRPFLPGKQVGFVKIFPSSSSPLGPFPSLTPVISRPSRVTFLHCLSLFQGDKISRSWFYTLLSSLLRIPSDP